MGKGTRKPSRPCLPEEKGVSPSLLGIIPPQTPHKVFFLLLQQLRNAAVPTRPQQMPGKCFPRLLPSRSLGWQSRWPEPARGAQPGNAPSQPGGTSLRAASPTRGPTAGPSPSLTRGRSAAPTAAGQRLRGDGGGSAPLRRGCGRLLGRAQGSHDGQNASVDPGQPLSEQREVEGTRFSLPIHPPIVPTCQQRCHPRRGRSPGLLAGRFHRVLPGKTGIPEAQEPGFR